jgi:diguanylate cyclase (GGDEF)-like protein
MPLVFFLAAWAGERQRLASNGSRHATAEVRRRPFSLLPYAAVAAVDGLLVAVTWSDHGTRDRAEIRVVVAAAVILTGLVVLRQVTVLLDNGRLLTELHHSATHDALTGLPNRVLFGRRLQTALDRPGDRPVSVALIDLDDFKEINDTLGHEVGDVLLMAVAERFVRCVEPSDTVARLGGDEFVVVLDGAGRRAADRTVQRMIDALRDPVVAGGHELTVRASIGITERSTGDDVGTLLRHADIAMYAAKIHPDSTYLRYDDAVMVTSTGRMTRARVTL